MRKRLENNGYEGTDVCMSYQYPLEETWTKEEIIDVIHFFTLVELAYESSVNRDQLLQAYRRFKEIVPSKSEEKVYFSDFERASAYSSYHVVKKARETDADKISMEN